MSLTTRHTRFASVIALALILGAPLLTPHRALADPAGQKLTRQQDNQMQADIKASLNSDRFKDVQVSVKNGIADLSGTVELYAYKEEAGRKAQRIKDAVAIRNQIRVAVAQLSDEDLQRKLLEKVQYDRVGYGTTAFNAISVQVHDGVVTLSGHAYGPTDKDSAISLATHMPGVRDVIDTIEVDPVSPMDDGIRIQVARSIYGYPQLNKYAIDPGKPIRISVQNGNVTLFGMVDNAMDRDVALIRANSVPGIFSVTNRLEVANEAPQRE
jgi:hyperosmotically inducible periplasmic protein